MADQKIFRIELSRGAEEDLANPPADVQRTVLVEIRRWLTREPFRGKKTRIKRLSGFAPPLYRLRIGDYRAYYRISADQVVILAFIHKKDTHHWLKRF